MKIVTHVTQTEACALIAKALAAKSAADGKRIAYTVEARVTSACSSHYDSTLTTFFFEATEHTPCRQCGAPVEDARECYATPVCYGCLPPPAPLPVAHTGRP